MFSAVILIVEQPNFTLQPQIKFARAELRTLGSLRPLKLACACQLQLCSTYSIIRAKIVGRFARLIQSLNGSEPVWLCTTCRYRDLWKIRAQRHPSLENASCVRAGMVPGAVTRY